MASKGPAHQAEEAAPASAEAPSGSPRPPPPPPSGGEEPQVPGAAFYAARLQRVVALSPGRRSRDAAAFLECDRLCGLAADLLNPLGAPAEAEDVPRAQLGLLAYLCGSFGELQLGVRRWSAPRCLIPLRLAPAALSRHARLLTQLQHGRMAAPPPLALLLAPGGGSKAAWAAAPLLDSLPLLVRAMAFCASMLNVSAGLEATVVTPGLLHAGHNLLCLALRSLSEPASTAALGAQLAELQTAADAAGASWQLPDAAALSALAARLDAGLWASAISAAARRREAEEEAGRPPPAGWPQPADEEEAEARRAAAVERYAQLCPDSPLACDLLAGAARPCEGLMVRAGCVFGPAALLAGRACMSGPAPPASCQPLACPLPCCRLLHVWRA